MVFHLRSISHLTDRNEQKCKEVRMQKLKLKNMKLYKTYHLSLFWSGHFSFVWSKELINKKSKLTNLFWDFVKTRSHTGQVGPMACFFGWARNLFLFVRTNFLLSRYASSWPWTSAMCRPKFFALSPLYWHCPHWFWSSSLVTSSISSSEKCRATCSRGGSRTSQTGQFGPMFCFFGFDCARARFLRSSVSSANISSSLEWPRAMCLTTLSLLLFV